MLDKVRGDKLATAKVSCSVDGKEVSSANLMFTIASAGKRSDESRFILLQLLKKVQSLAKMLQWKAFVLLAAKQKISDGTIIRHHASVEGDVFLGKNNEIFPYALIGGLTHDLKYKGGSQSLGLVKIMFSGNL